MTMAGEPLDDGASEAFDRTGQRIAGLHVAHAAIAGQPRGVTNPVRKAAVICAMPHYDRFR